MNQQPQNSEEALLLMFAQLRQFRTTVYLRVCKMYALIFIRVMCDNIP